jgi:hypothetical protein
VKVGPDALPTGATTASPAPGALDARSGDEAEPLVAPRLPYQRPRLRHLGSVRELTLGGSAGFVEGAGTFRKPM